MDELSDGWRFVPAWGLHGWDLGDWPYVIACVYSDPAEPLYGMATYTEGDIEVRAFDTAHDRNAALDEIAAWHWRHGMPVGPDDLPPEGEPLLPHHRRPFSWGRWERERGQSQGGVR